MNAFTKATFARDAVTIVWVVLTFGTLLSWWVGAEHGIAVQPVAGSVLVLIAAVKVCLVGESFMEVGAQPRAIRIAFQVWLFTTTISLIVLICLA
jgi:hypothetical protein